MAAHIVDSTATQVATGPVEEAVVVVNAALTGSITVADATSGSTPAVAIITNPTVGLTFRYRGLVTGFRVIASGACDVTAYAGAE